MADSAVELQPFDQVQEGDRPAEIDATGRRLRFEIDDSSGGNVGAVRDSRLRPRGGLTQWWSRRSVSASRQNSWAGASQVAWLVGG